MKVCSEIRLKNSEHVLVFTNKFNVYKFYELKVRDRTEILQALIMEPGEEVVYITGTTDYSGYLIAGFENGKMSKVNLNAFTSLTKRKKMANAYSDQSPLVFIEHIEADIDLAAISSINKVMVFNTSEINPVNSGKAQGVYVMKSKDKSDMVEVKKLNKVQFQNPDYYRKGIPAIGYYLLEGDVF